MVDFGEIRETVVWWMLWFVKVKFRLLVESNEAVVAAVDLTPCASVTERLKQIEPSFVAS